MHIVVCLNHIPDPEMPAKQFRLEERTGRPVFQRVNYVIGPFDENALEMALQLREAVGGKVTALTAGPATNLEALRRALALRCDAAIHLKEERATELDSAAIARLLAAAIRRLGGVDLVLCGRQVGDWDGGQVGQLLAEDLAFSCVTVARQIEPEEGRALRVTKEVPGGTAVASVRLPAVVSITNTPANQIRIPKVKDAMAAYKVPITAWSAVDLGLDVAELAASPRVLLRRLFVPETKVQVEMIEGQNDEEIAAKLARRIRDLNVM